jgi:hypothetical protein
MHFGMAPLAMLWEVDGSNNGATVNGITLQSPAFENCGNGLFYSMSTDVAGGGHIQNMKIIGATADQGFAASFQSAALRVHRAHFDALATVDVSCDASNDPFGFLAGPVPASLQYDGTQAISFDVGYASFLQSMITHGGRLLVNPGSFVAARVQVRERLGNCESEMCWCDAVAVTAGRLVYRSGDGGVKPWVAGKAVYGVALQSGSAYDFIPVGRRGTWPVDNSATSALAIGDAVIPDAATADGKVTIAGGASGASIGAAAEAALVGVSVRVDFTPSGWRF